MRNNQDFNQTSESLHPIRSLIRFTRDFLTHLAVSPGEGGVCRFCQSEPHLDSCPISIGFRMCDRAERRDRKEFRRICSTCCTEFTARSRRRTLCDSCRAKVWRKQRAEQKRRYRARKREERGEGS